MVPAPFRSLRALRVLNVAAVGLALAAVVSVVFTALFHMDSTVALSTGMPTWVLGTLWALLLRWPRTIKNTSFRVGWIASMPLAAVNAGVACSLMFLDSSRSLPVPLGFLIGATFGVVCWLPALLLTLLCFGVPIASAQRLAARGLAGEERGERVVGLACVVMSALAFAGASFLHGAQLFSFLPLIYGFASLGFLTGGTATLLAHAREARRRGFVARAEAGEVPGYRVDPTEEGKVLVRIVSKGEGYRVADFEEEVFDLGAEGEATRPRALVR